jgi:hypothetical protein
VWNPSSSSSLDLSPTYKDADIGSMCRPLWSMWGSIINEWGMSMQAAAVEVGTSVVSNKWSGSSLHVNETDPKLT